MLPGIAFARRGADDPAGDDRGGTGVEAGDDNGGNGQEPGDDNGGNGNEPGDDNGGNGNEPGDDNGGDRSSASGSGEKSRLRSSLVRTAESPDPDAKGYVETRTDGGRDRLKVEAEHLTPGDVVSLSIDDGAGGTIDLGTREVSSFGEAEYEFDTREGAPLPGGAASVSELSGRTVTVRTASGDPMLTGGVPGGAASAASGQVKAKVGSSDDANGKLRLRERKNGRCDLRIRLRGLAASTDYEIWVETAAGSGTYERAFAFTTDRRGRFKLTQKTKDGDALLGADCASDLAGRAFEIRALTGETVLDGAFPSF
jgi:hypothetical protein